MLVRKALLSDIPAIQELIQVSARSLAANYYPPEQIEGALQSAWGVDSQLILDGTYFLTEAGGKIVGCGGWSWRKTLFGGNQQSGRSPEALDPGTDAARIRAFFVHPDWARKGIGRRLLDESAKEAGAAGFRSLQLMATLSGRRFYESLGFVVDSSRLYPLPNGLEIEFLTMNRSLRSASRDF